MEGNEGASAPPLSCKERKRNATFFCRLVCDGSLWPSSSDPFCGRSDANNLLRQSAVYLRGGGGGFAEEENVGSVFIFLP